MSEQIEYIEPTQEHVGQMVEVRDARRWVRRKLLAVLPSPQAYRFICESIVDTDEFSKWQFARIARPLTYAERQARCGLKVGDRVKFVRAWEPNEYSTTLEFIHSSSGMNREVGQTGLLTHIGKEAMRVQFAAQYWYLPYFVLEKVEDRVATRDDIGKQVYIDGASGDIFAIEIIYGIEGDVWRAGIEGDVWRAVIRSGDNRFVYELRNLRVKE